MGDVPTASSFLNEGEVRNRTTDGSSHLVQVWKIPEPPQFLFFVSTRRLSDLCRITVAQLRVEERARGFYLLLRTLKPTVTGKVNSDLGPNALVLAEDHFGNRIFCCLYGHVHLKSETELKDSFPVNTVFALKEPLLKGCSEQHFAVVVGSPTDFVVIGRGHVMSNDVEALGWREKLEDEGNQLTDKWHRIGNELLKKGKINDATDAYLFALNNCTENYMRLALTQNLAMSFLAQECYESAVKHAENVLQTEPLNETALYCAGRAQYELREYTKAKLYFETLKCVIPTDKNYWSEVIRCEERLREVEGNVDIYKLYRASLTDVTVPIDHGNFWSKIEFRPGPGNVRGVFATQNIDPGTLILVEKAIVTIFEPQFSNCRVRGIANFMRAVFKVVLKNPKTLGQKLRYLPGGYSITEENRSIFCDEVNELEPIVDVRRLYQIIQRNILKSNNIMVENAPLSYHVYEAASRFRHSCLSNCSFLAYKDVVVVRTCASVLKGEELFLHYYGNHLSFPEKQEAFELSGLGCTCLLCAQDDMEIYVIHDLRQELKRMFDAQMALGAGVNFSAEERLLPIVKELELTYRNRSSFRLLLFVVYRDLAKVVDRRSEDWKDKVTLYVERGLQSVGLSIAYLLSCTEQVNPNIIHFGLMPAVLFDFAGLMAEKEYSSGRLDLVEKWVQVILLMERIYRGGNLEMLMQRYSASKEVTSFLSAFA